VTSPPLATAREWRGLAILALPTLLLSLDVSVLYLALPQLSADLGATGTEQLWILDIYSFLLAGFLITMGAVGDRIGRRRLLLIGAAAFGVASVLAAYARTPEMLIAARAALGVAGATLMPSTMALIRNMFPDPRQMGQAIGLWFACFMGGMTLGPLVGGVLLESFWWGSAFLLGVPFMVLLLVAGPRLLPEYRDPTVTRPDLTSVVLSLAAILPLVFGLKSLARDGWAMLPLAAIAAGAVVGAMFLRRQGRLANPLLDLRLFHNRTFSTALGVMLCTGVIMAGTSLVAALYLQTVRGLSPLEAGLWMIPSNIAMVTGSMLAPRIAGRISTVRLIAGGLAIAAAGMAVLTQTGPDSGTGLLVGGLVITMFGISLPMALLMSFLLGSAPPEKAGSAASINEMSGELGIALGIATLGSLGTLVYRHQIDGNIPAGVPEQAVTDGIATAVAAAQRLPATVATELLDAAGSAYTDGLHVVAGVGAVGFLVLALLAARVLRGTGPAPAEAPVDDRDLAATATH
jgi:DHA2 family multidrug resistance protein-like MFS transporter